MTHGEKVREIQRYYEAIWNNPAPWSLSEYNEPVYKRIIAMLADKRYPRALEIGCGSGAFTRHLAPLADRVLGVDIATNAIARARAQSPGGNVEFEVANIMDCRLDAQDPWDLIVFGETIYCLGCSYTFFEITWLARELFKATRQGGRLLLSNCQATDEEDSEDDLRPWVIRSYRDVFLNVGYRLEAEVNVQVPNDYGFETLISMFAK